MIGEYKISCILRIKRSFLLKLIEISKELLYLGMTDLVHAIQAINGIAGIAQLASILPGP